MLLLKQAGSATSEHKNGFLSIHRYTVVVAGAVVVASAEVVVAGIVVDASGVVLVKSEHVLQHCFFR